MPIFRSNHYTIVAFIAILTVSLMPVRLIAERVESLNSDSVSQGASGQTQNFHIVQQGETIGSIARLYHIYISQIIAWNNLKDIELTPGQKLIVFKGEDSSICGQGDSGREGSVQKKELSVSDILDSLVNATYFKHGHFSASSKENKCGFPSNYIPQYSDSVSASRIAVWKKDAAKGLSYAQFNLVVIYINGVSVRQSYPEAMRWFRLAASQGVASAQFNLGVMYHNGQGVRQNKKVAKEWFGKACDNGNQGGCDEYRKLNEAGIK